MCLGTALCRASWRLMQTGVQSREEGYQRGAVLQQRSPRERRVAVLVSLHQQSHQGRLRAVQQQRVQHTLPLQHNCPRQHVLPKLVAQQDVRAQRVEKQLHAMHALLAARRHERRVVMLVTFVHKGAAQLQRPGREQLRKHPKGAVAQRASAHNVQDVRPGPRQLSQWRGTAWRADAMCYLKHGLWLRRRGGWCCCCWRLCHWRRGWRCKGRREGRQSTGRLQLCRMRIVAACGHG